MTKFSGRNLMIYMGGCIAGNGAAHHGTVGPIFLIIGCSLALFAIVRMA